MISNLRAIKRRQKNDVLNPIFISGLCVAVVPVYVGIICYGRSQK